jgi:hypothetical protein
MATARLAAIMPLFVRTLFSAVVALVISVFLCFCFD